MDRKPRPGTRSLTAFVPGIDDMDAISRPAEFCQDSARDWLGWYVVDSGLVMKVMFVLVDVVVRLSMVVKTLQTIRVPCCLQQRKREAEEIEEGIVY